MRPSLLPRLLVAVEDDCVVSFEEERVFFSSFLDVQGAQL